MTRREDEGGADGGVEGAHAIDDGVGSVHGLQQAGVGRREHLVLAHGPLRAQIEDAPDGRCQRGAPAMLLHLYGPRRLCCALQMLCSDQISALKQVTAEISV